LAIAGLRSSTPGRARELRALHPDEADDDSDRRYRGEQDRRAGQVPFRPAQAAAATDSPQAALGADRLLDRAVILVPWPPKTNSVREASASPSATCCAEG